MKKQSKQNCEFTALHRINTFFGCIDNIDELLQRIMSEASQTVKAEASSIALYDSRGKNLRFTVSLGKKGKQIKEITLKLGQGIIGYAALHKKPLNIPDVSKDRRFHADVDKKVKFKTKSILAVPILRKQKLIGALEVINKKGAGHFTSADTKLLEIVAGQAAIAIENAQLYERLLQKHAALRTKHNRVIEMQKKMIRMERLSAIGDTTARVVHDLRNPFMVIGGCVELLRDGTASTEEREKYCKIVTDEIQRLNGMTSEVMNFVKGKTDLLFQNHHLGDFLQEVATYLERDFQPHNISLEIEANYNGKIYMDKFKIQRAIFNISFNARDAMTAGGKFKIQSNYVDNMMELRLMDTGPGMPQEIIKRLGEPFATSGKAHGTGLGLAIVKKIITEIHHGSFTVESRQPPVAGEFNTTFILKIPVSAPENTETQSIQ